MAEPIDLRAEDLRGYVDYLRDLGVYNLYSSATPAVDAAVTAWAAQHLREPGASPTRRPARPAPAASPAPPTAGPSPFERSVQRTADRIPDRTVAPVSRPLAAGGLRPVPPQITIAPPLAASPAPPPLAALPMETDDARGIVGGEMAPVPFNLLRPLPASRVAPADRAAALQALRADIGDCTRCPLAYAGRHTIVFGDGDPNARLLFVGEGPGADEDETGIPFVGKAGQLLNNMIGAMGLKRESVYIANVVKCRPPKNRTPEPGEANTCSQFLLRQIDIVQPEVIVALGATAATYLLGVKQSLSSLRGQWFDVRGAKCAVTYHPAYLLRDPRQKGEAWKDLQRVMVEMKLTPPARG